MFKKIRLWTIVRLVQITIGILVTYTCFYTRIMEKSSDNTKANSEILIVAQHLIPSILRSEVTIPELSVERSRFDNQRIVSL